MSTVIAEVTTRVPSAVNFAKLYVVPPDVKVPKAPPPVTVGRSVEPSLLKRTQWFVDFATASWSVPVIYAKLPIVFPEVGRFATPA
jgi:hypothetical protein